VLALAFVVVSEDPVSGYPVGLHPFYALLGRKCFHGPKLFGVESITEKEHSPYLFFDHMVAGLAEGTQPVLVGIPEAVEFFPQLGVRNKACLDRIWGDVEVLLLSFAIYLCYISLSGFHSNLLLI